MLHILLFILKIIGWIVLAVLGVLVLLICVTLFVPFRYKVQACCHGNPKDVHMEAVFHILFRMFAGKVQFADGKFDWQVRFLWKKAGSDLAQKLSDDKPVKKETPKKAREEKTERKRLKEEKEQRMETEKPTDSPKEDPKEEKTDVPPKKQREKQEAQDKGGNSEKRKNKLSFSEKIEAVFAKIKYTIQEICDKIKALWMKKALLAEFSTEAIHRRAFSRTAKELKKMLFRLRPEKIRADIYFGFTDPSLTGKVYAGSCVILPMLGHYVTVLPDFEKKILQGELYIKGHIRAVTFFALLFNLFRDKNVRTTFKHGKNLFKNLNRKGG